MPGAAVGGLLLGVIEAVAPPLVLEGLNVPGAHQLKDVKIAVEEGMKEKSREFLEQGAEVYREIALTLGTIITE